jgi:hypothetical protein
MRLGGSVAASLRGMSDSEAKPRTRIQEPTADELNRIRVLLRRIGGESVSWGAVNSLEVWLAETRLEAERVASRRLLIATWVLAAATIALVFATIGLIVVAV